ncbi:MAG TPA: iron-containing alcohol dehydrogenase [Bacteroidales bacterium]|nr:iron-containing alcohol dehydrogenase [Bacteroidales bacterium]
MVKPFQFARIPAIHFKNGIIVRLPEFVRIFGSRLIIVTGKSSFLKSYQAEKLFADLEKDGDVWHHIFISSEPTPEMIDNAVRQIGDVTIDLVIGIGGGSALDAGKAVSAMLYKKDSVKEYLEMTGTKTHPGTKIPYIAVSTTSGTGSEATKNAVISHTGPDGFKRSLRHDNFVPEIALIDPELTLNCPADLTAASGMDCFTQLTEAYLSDKSHPYTDALAFEGLKAVKSSLLRSCKDGSDIEARAGMSFAALTSGICLANAGLGVVHGFASSMGARYDIPHGIICGTLMASANEINIRILRKKKNEEALLKYASLGRLFLDRKEGSDDYFIDGFIEYLYSLSEEIKLPGLKTAGAEESDFTEIVRNTDCKNNPVKISPDDLLAILQKRYF